MRILDRLRERLDAVTTLFPGLARDDAPLAFSAELPGGVHGALMKLDVRVETEPHGDGERLCLRAHLQSNFASVLKPLLNESAPHAALPRSETRSLARRERIGLLAERGLRRAMNNRLARRLAEPLLRTDVNTWLEVQASTASLDAGAHALVPQNEKLAALGIRPTRREGAHMENWSGAAGNGFAQVSLLQLDKASLPPALAKRLGDQPFNLAAMMVNTVEEK